MTDKLLAVAEDVRAIAYALKHLPKTSDLFRIADRLAGIKNEKKKESLLLHSTDLLVQIEQQAIDILHQIQHLREIAGLPTSEQWNEFNRESEQLTKQAIGNPERDH